MNIEKSRSFSLKSCCCINIGICGLNAIYPQDTYSPSQISKFYVEVNNTDSKLNILRIITRLMCSLSMKDAYNRRHFISFEVLSHIYNVRIPPGEALINNSGVEISVNLPSLKNLSNMCTSYGKLI